MKAKLLLSAFVLSFCSILFSSCSEEQVLPKDRKTAQNGVTQADDGF
jgi:hypothetical protein